MCEKRATSREHVPQKAFFPKVGELPKGIFTQKELMTVPSCDEHNTHKSMDDEYAYVVVAANADVNSVGATSSGKRITRAVTRRPSFVGIFKNPFPAAVNGRPTIGFEIDLPRLQRTFTQMARAVFFYHFKKKYRGKIDIVMPSVIKTAGTDLAVVNRFLAGFKEISRSFFSNVPRHGENPLIFYYQIGNAKVERDGDDRLVVNMVFYEGVIVQALLRTGARHVEI